MKRVFFAVIGAIIASACSTNSIVQDQEAEAVVNSFATAYFNLDYPEAKKYVTKESYRWLSYAILNVTLSDIDVANADEKGATVNVDDISLVNDSLAIVSISGSHLLTKDSIGLTAHFIDDACYKLTVVRRGGKSLVKMEGPLRNERQNHD